MSGQQWWATRGDLSRQLTGMIIATVTAAGSLACGLYKMQASGFNKLLVSQVVDFACRLERCMPCEGVVQLHPIQVYSCQLQ
jgi:hypothetical protein